MDHYGTLAGALAYHAISAGGAAWSNVAYDETQRSNALIRASRSLDGQYGARYSGYPTHGREQTLGWPRTNAYDYCQVLKPYLPIDVVPVEIENATYALALLELETPGSTVPSFTPGSVNKREKVDVIERERFGPKDGVSLSLDMQRIRLSEVEDMLRCLLNNNAMVQNILRV